MKNTFTIFLSLITFAIFGQNIGQDYRVYWENSYIDYFDDNCLGVNTRENGIHSYCDDGFLLQEKFTTPGSEDIHAVIKGSDGNIYIGAWDEGLNNHGWYSFSIFDPDTRTFQVYHNENQSHELGRVYCLEEYQNKIFIGTYNGMFIFENGEFTQLNEQNSNLKTDYVYDIKKGINDDLWIRAYKGLYKFEEDTLRFIDSLNSLGRNMLISEDETFYFFNSDGYSFQVWDQETTLHFDSIQYDTLKLPIRSINSGAEFNEKIYFNSGLGLVEYDPQTKSANRLVPEVEGGTSISFDWVMKHNDGLGFGTSEGLGYYDGENWSFEMIVPDGLKAYYSVGRDSLILCTYRTGSGGNEGCYFYTKEDEYQYLGAQSSGLQDQEILYISETDSGMIMIATEFGLSYYDPSKGFYKYNDTIFDNIYDIHEDPLQDDAYYITDGYDGVYRLHNDTIDTILDQYKGGEYVKVSKLGFGISYDESFNRMYFFSDDTSFNFMVYGLPNVAQSRDYATIDTSGNIYLGGDEEFMMISSLDSSTWTVYDSLFLSPGESITSIHATQDGKIYFSSNMKGLLLFQGDSMKRMNVVFENDTLTNIWISGSDSAGNLYLSSNYFPLLYYSNGTTTDLTFGPHFDKGASIAHTVLVGKNSDLYINNHDGLTIIFNSEPIIYTETETIQEKVKSHSSIYPNPSSGLINIMSDEKYNKIKVVSTIGSLLMEKNITQSNQQIDLSNLPNGMYYLILSNDEGQDKIETISIQH